MRDERGAAPHSTHAAAVVAPVVVRYLPAPHATHGAAPAASLKVPAAHASHSAPSWPLSNPTLSTLEGRIESDRLCSAADRVVWAEAQHQTEEEAYHLGTNVMVPTVVPLPFCPRSACPLPGSMQTECCGV